MPDTDQMRPEFNRDQPPCACLGTSRHHPSCPAHGWCMTTVYGSNMSPRLIMECGTHGVIGTVPDNSGPNRRYAAMHLAEHTAEHAPKPAPETHPDPLADTEARELRASVRDAIASVNDGAAACKRAADTLTAARRRLIQDADTIRNLRLLVRGLEHQLANYSEDVNNAYRRGAAHAPMPTPAPPKIPQLADPAAWVIADNHLAYIADDEGAPALDLTQVAGWHPTPARDADRRLIAELRSLAEHWSAASDAAVHFTAADQLQTCGRIILGRIAESARRSVDQSVDQTPKARPCTECASDAGHNARSGR